MMRRRGACARGVAAASRDPDNNEHNGYDYSEKTDRVELTIDIPGIKRKDIKVIVDEEERELEVSGVRRTDVVQKFSKSFSLDKGLEPGAMTAKHADGVLHIAIPKKQKAPPMEIAVTDASTEDAEKEEDFDMVQVETIADDDNQADETKANAAESEGKDDSKPAAKKDAAKAANLKPAPKSD